MSVRKPADARVRGSRTRDLASVPAVVGWVGPPASAHWSPAVVEQWHDLWASPLADPRVITSADGAALLRLFDYRQRLVDALERFDESPEERGSTGQLVLSPWSAEVHRLEAAIGRLEDRFGLTPGARLKLGVSVAQTQAAVAKSSTRRGTYSQLRNDRTSSAVETAEPC